MADMNLTPDEEHRLAVRALEIREQAWCPYSRFRVGAALLDERGEIFVGCNVENASFPLGVCAEAAAIAAMIAGGGRRLRAIAVAGGRDAVSACTPCGGCRQRIAEFAEADAQILVLDGAASWQRYTLAELLPASFHLD
jgi:cytidine deaminase